MDQRKEWMWLAVVLVIQALIVLATTAIAGAVFTSSDEYCRLSYAIEWTHQSFYGPEDHIWLGGNFWILGSFIRLFDHPPIVGVFYGGVSSLVAVAFVYLILREAKLPLFAAFAGVLLFSTRPISMALAKSPQPAMLFTAGIFGAIYFALKHFNREQSWRPSLFWLAGSFCLIVAQMHRYEAWQFTVPWGFAAFYMFLMCLARKRWTDAALWIPLGLILIVFPISWILDSARILGSPFAFLENMRSHLRTGFLGMDFEIWTNRLLYYPMYIAFQIPILAPLGIAGLVWIVWKGNRPQKLVAWMVIVYAALILYNSITRGSGNNWPHRIVYPISSILMLLAPIGALAFLRWMPERAIASILLGILFTGTLVYEVIKWPGLFYHDVPPRQLAAIASHLQQIDNGQRERVLVDVRHLSWYFYFEDWVVKTHAGRLYYAIGMKSDEMYNLSINDDDNRYFIFKENRPPEESFQLIAVEEPYSLWEKVE